ncbi:MAG: DUF6677 family protein [Planctomycetota bacterium]
MAQGGPATGDQWNPAAAVAGWALPGLGHVLLGETRRGLGLGLVIGAVFVTGLLVGGPDILDAQRSRLTFLGQALLGPAILAEHWADGLRATAGLGADADADRPLPDANPPYSPAFGRAREVAVLYTVAAGLLNLLAMLDVLHRRPAAGPASGPEHEPSPADTGPTNTQVEAPAPREPDHDAPPGTPA